MKIRSFEDLIEWFCLVLYKISEVLARKFPKYVNLMIALSGLAIVYYAPLNPGLKLTLGMLISYVGATALLIQIEWW